VRPPTALQDWILVIGFFLLGFVINAILAVAGLYVLELVGLWPPAEPSSAAPSVIAAQRLAR
jgi:hypothetical protein